MSQQTAENTQYLTVNYRNAIFQGHFSRHFDCKQGFGLVYCTDNHMMMGTHWQQDEVTGPTFIYYNHSHYVYGFWQQNQPHGLNCIRMDKIVFFAFYDMGTILKRLLVIYEDQCTAAILERNDENQFKQIQNGDLLNDHDFNHFISKCNWPEFKDQCKTLIKFLAAYFVNQNVPKNQQCKLRLVNQSFYRYGFDEGIAIIFDDEYRIISIGVHRKAKLIGLGILFKQNVIEQGNFGKENQIFVFNYTHRPQIKLQKLYSHHMLRGVNFVNKFVYNPAKYMILHLEGHINFGTVRKYIQPQITLRNLQGSAFNYNKQQQKRRIEDLEGIEQIKFRRQIENQNLQQEKARLEQYKRQIYESINRKSRITANDDFIKQLTPQKIQKRDPIKGSRVINKDPVDIAVRSSKKKDMQKDILNETKGRSRSPIFTPQKLQNKSTSLSKVSPFKQKMRSKIFKQPKKYSFEPITNQLYPKHSSIKKYSSPHEQLQFSRQANNDVRQQVFPLSVKKQRLHEFVYNNDLHEIIKNKPQKSPQQKQFKRSSKQTNNERQKTLKMQNRQPSYENIYQQKQNQRGIIKTNTPNIIITSPNKSKSPGYKRIVEYNYQNRQEQYRKNNVYLRTEPKLAYDQTPQKGKRQIKGQTYLERYRQNRPQVQQRPQITFKQSRKYNKTIKNFNQNSKIYEKVQSSPQQEKRNKQKQSLTEFAQIHPIKNGSNIASLKQKKNYQYIYE